MNEQWIIGELSKAMDNPAVKFGDRTTIEQAVFDLACSRLRDNIKTLNENERLRQQLNRDVQVAKDYEATIERMRIERDTARLEGKIRAKPTDLEAEVERLRAALKQISEIGHDPDNGTVPYEAKIADKALCLTDNSSPG